jgi:hypothetical protein
MPRTRKSAHDETPPGAPPTDWRWLVQLALPLVAGAAVLAGLLWLGRLARERLRDREAHVIYFTDIECDPPPGLSRREFLDEVQYLAGLPDRLNLLEPDTNARIADGLAQHPWVRRVRRVEQLPPHRVHVDLEYRQAVLAVARPPRVVDADGVPLPASAGSDGLPLLRTNVAPPASPPGQPWPDVRVVAAAQVAALLHPHLDTLGLRGCSVAIDGGVVTLSTARTRVVWGLPPGHEREGEASAAMKLDRLRAAGRLDDKEYDLRQAQPR